MKKRILSILLTLCMVLCLVPISVFAEGGTATGSAAILLGTDALNKTVNTANAPTVYFGQNQENNPGAWRVIGYDGSGVAGTAGNMTLLAASNMSSGLQFADFGASNEYAPSNLKTAIDALAEKLTTEENTAVKKRTLTSGSYNGENTDCVAGAQVDNAVFWPLSTAEAFAVNQDLRIADPEHPSWASSCWWLRSPGYSNHDAATVRGDGSVVYYGNAINSWWCVRPAFNLNLNSVLFTSAAVGGKPDGGLTEVPEYTGNEWKLTLKDSNRNFAVTETTVSGDPGDTVTLHYTGATAGINEYISFILADNSGAQYYGRVAQPTAENGTVEIKIPSGLAPGSYTLKVFSEQCNDDKKTDYASDFVDIDLTVGYQEQFTLTPGGTYYFDLSSAGIPGTANDALPDNTMHYVPFTYAGTVDAYKLTSEMATTEEYAQQNEYAHSLFVADYAVTHAVSWDNLNAEKLIFGKDYATGSVEYTIRVPSGGSAATDMFHYSPGTPQSNEWDRILDKNGGYIKNCSKIYSWGQDTLPYTESNRVVRGLDSPRNFAGYNTTLDFSHLVFRPVLEVLNPDTLGTDGLKAVTLDLGGGKLGGSSDNIQIIVKNGESFTAPASDGLTRPDGNTGSYFKWRGSDGKLYAPGDNVPADVDKLTAQFDDSGSHTVTITTDALPDGKVGETYSQTLAADGTAPITWSISGGALPDGLKLDENTGGISGEPTAEGTATFTVKAENSGGSDTKELSITITKDAPAEYTVTVTTEGSGTASASHAKAVAGTEITLTATPDTGYRFKEWEVISGGVVITNNKFTMPDGNVEVKAIFEEDMPPMPTDPAKPGISVTGTYTYNGSEHTAAVTGYDSATMDISGNTGTDAGDYTVSVTSRTGRWADGSTEAVTAVWSISKATQEAPNGLAGVAPTTEGGSDGRITGVDTMMEYRMAGDGSYTACGGTEIENLSAGNYFVRYAEDNNHFASPDGEVTVGDGTPLADCAITFNAGGGSGSMESKTVKEGTNYILPACGFTAPTDQEFKAWEIGGTEYKVGDSYTVKGDTEIKALWKDSVIPPTTYTVTISNDGNGSGTASPSAAVVGTEITLTATPNTGYRFKEWEVISGGVAITNNKFTMPDGNVEVKAIFEKDAPPAPTEYTVTVTSGGNGTASVSHAKAVVGTEITLTAMPDTGYRFKEWEIISGGVAITNNKFTMPDGNVEVKAIFEKDAPPAPTEYTVTVTSGGNGTASASHAKAVVGTEITLTATPNTGYRFKEWEVISGGVVITNNKFTMPDGNVEVRAIFAMISQQTAPDPVNENTGIPSQPENSGTASASHTDSGTNNGAGAAPASPFSATPGTEPAPGIKPGAENTRRTTPKDSILLREWQDKRDTTTITGDQPAADEEAEEGNNPFTDVSKDDWFYDDVMFVYENGLMEGISSTQFGPYETQTRGRMAEILWRMEGSPAPKAKNSFADVEDGARYADAIAWIAENDILSGYNKDSFGPGDPITWEQLAVMFYRYAQYKGYDISIKGSQDELKDMDSTMDDAGKAVLWAVSNGLIREEADVLSALQDPVSRAEIAAMLHRFIDKYKLVQGMTPNGQMGWITPEEMNPSQTDRSRVPGWIGISLCAALTGGFVLFMLWLRHRRRVM